MPSIRDILDALERVAPSRFAFSFDKVGLQIGNPGAIVQRAIVSLDRSQGAAEFAIENGADLLLSHHPLIWDPLKSITTSNYAERTAITLLKNNVAFIAAHTNWDSAKGGINDTLAGLFGLLNVTSFGDAAAVSQLKLVVFSPKEALQLIIDAATGAGAGVIGQYSRCAFFSKGTGTFLGEAGSHPAIGQAGKVEETQEVRLEMVLPASAMDAVSEAVRQNHPYETPAFEFLRLSDFAEQPIGRLGELPEPCRLRELSDACDRNLSTRCWAWGSPDRRVARVAVCGGAADDVWQDAKRAGADVLVTGEVKQHIGLEVSESDFAVVAAGHYATEHPGCVALAERMRLAMPDVEWIVYEPSQGDSGRPF
jgi:dinuclear metal center YbgI/SA1388 family protein